MRGGVRIRWANGRSANQQKNPFKSVSDFGQMVVCKHSNEKF